MDEKIKTVLLDRLLSAIGKMSQNAQRDLIRTYMVDIRDFRSVVNKAAKLANHLGKRKEEGE